MIKNCRQCGKEFNYYLSQEKRRERKFCSIECRNFSYEKKVSRKCNVCGVQFLTIVAYLRKGGGFYCSRVCLFECPEWRKKQSETHKLRPNRYWLGKERPEISGKNHYNWRGGLTPERQSGESVRWRKHCLKRDDYRCFDCGEVKKGQMEVDHVYPFALFPRLRFELRNGEIVCRECHDIRTTKVMREYRLGLFQGRPLAEFRIKK